MDWAELDVLLVGGTRQGWWHLAEHLEQLGCRCWFACTAEDVQGLLIQRRFRLILSARPVTQGSNRMELLRAPERTVFYSFPVENGCLWIRALPEMIRGAHPSTLRPGEFINVLDEAVAGLRGDCRQFPSYDIPGGRTGPGVAYRAASARIKHAMKQRA